MISSFFIITIIVLGVIIILLIVEKVLLSIQFRKDIKLLFSHSKFISQQKFSYSQLEGLPEPVQRYFRLVLKEGQPYISFVRLKHTGQFKPGLDKKWVNIKGEQYFTAEKPGFIWKGTTSLFTARDMYISDQGRLVVSLFSFFGIASEKGKKFDQGELLRWLGESVWFPTNLLPGDRLQWLPVDNKTANLVYNYNGLSISYIVSFNARGEIIQLKTKRYMGNENLETWVGKLSDYQEIGGIVVPNYIEAIWRLEKGDHSYARFQLTKLEYNNRESF